MNDIKQALCELSVYKEPKETKSNKPYYSIDEYWERMNAVLGRDGYRAFYSEFKEVILPTGQVMLSCKCHLEILGDAGEVAFVTEGYGSEEIAVANETGRYIMLNTSALNCQIAAFKSACKELGIFGCRDMSVKGRYKGKGNCSGSGASGSNGGSSKKETAMEFLVKKPLKEFWKDSQGKPAYRMIAQPVVNGQVQDAEVEVLFYANYYGKNTETFNKLYLRSADTQTGFRVTLKVVEVEDKKKNKDFSNSLTFRAFGGG